MASGIVLRSLQPTNNKKIMTSLKSDLTTCYQTQQYWFTNFQAISLEYDLYRDRNHHSISLIDVFPHLDIFSQSFPRIKW
jgi:hypothetical protein